MARPPLSLKKIRHEPFKSPVLFHTTYSQYFKQNVKMFEALDFIAELTQHIPPKGVQLIRRYGLYSSRIKGRWSEMAYVVERAPGGWKASREAATDDPEDLGFEPLSASETVEVDADCRKQAWAGLLTKVYDGYAPRSIRLSAPNAYPK